MVRLHGFDLLLVCNSRADAVQRNYGGACVQMRLSFSSLAPFFLYFIQWLDCGCCYALPSYLGLFHILICKVKVAVCSFGIWTSCICFSLQEAWVSGIKVKFCLYRFMLMEIAQCRHMKGGQALGNSMVIARLYGHFVTSTSICGLNSHKLLALQQLSILYCSSLRVV